MVCVVVVVVGIAVERIHTLLTRKVLADRLITGRYRALQGSTGLYRAHAWASQRLRRPLGAS